MKNLFEGFSDLQTENFGKNTCEGDADVVDVGIVHLGRG